MPSLRKHPYLQRNLGATQAHVGLILIFKQVHISACLALLKFRVGCYHFIYDDLHISFTRLTSTTKHHRC